MDKKTGAVKVHKVTCAVDCGPVVNPAIVSAQMMGGLIMGQSAAMKEKIEFANGGVKSENFSDYELLPMSEAPEVDVHIVKSDEKLGGIGEPGTPPAGARHRERGVRGNRRAGQAAADEAGDGARGDEESVEIFRTQMNAENRD